MYRQRETKQKFIKIYRDKLQHNHINNIQNIVY